MKKLLAGALIFITVFFSSGSAVSAATIDELQAQLNALLLQISQLQGQGSASPATPALANASANASFNRNLNFGLKNDPDVMRLQALLGVDQTGNFGPLTQAAVRTFQASNGIDSTGFVGPQTREALGLRLVEPEVVDYRPSAPANPSSTPSNVSISGVTVTKSFGPLPCQATAPTAGISLKPGAPFCMYIWAHNTNDSERLVKIDMPANDPKLNFSDATRQFILQPGRFGYMNVISSVKSSATPGTYSSPTSVSVVGVSGSGYFPSGSGTVYANIGIVDTSAITPTATDNTSTPKVELYVNGVRSSTTISNGGYVILSWKYYNMSSGCTVGVKGAGSLATSGTGTGVQGYNVYNITQNETFVIGCDKDAVSDQVQVNISSADGSTGNGAAAPVVTLTASPSTITAGQSATLLMGVTDTSGISGCKLNGQSLTLPFGSASTVRPTSTTAYTLTCTNTSGQSSSASATVTVNSTVVLPSTLSSFSFTTSSTNITVGQSATLTWSASPATNATITGCTLANSNGNLNQGTSVATSGSTTVSPTVLTVYRLSCMGSNGQGKSQDISINVTASNAVSSGLEVLNDGVSGPAASIYVMNNTNGYWVIDCGGAKVSGYGTKTATVHTGSSPDGVVCIMTPGQVSGYNFPPKVWNSRSNYSSYLLVEPNGGGNFQLTYTSNSAANTFTAMKALLDELARQAGLLH